jgi:hypothetical protein
MDINLLNKSVVIHQLIDGELIYNITIEKIVDRDYNLFMTDSSGIRMDFPNKTVLYFDKYNVKYDIMRIDNVYKIYDDVKHYELHINGTVWDIRFDTEWTIEKRQNNININHL